MVLPDPHPDWAPAWFSPSVSDSTAGPNIYQFSESLLRASRGFRAGEPLRFTAWQRWLADRLFELNADGFYKHRRAVVGVPRKNGKSILGTAFALEGLVFGQPGSQVYSAASDRTQAKIVFGEARQQVLNNPALLKILKVYRDAIEYPARQSVYRALSADAGLNQGLGPSLVVADEIHAWPSTSTNTRGDELWAALTEGSGDRPESLVVGITTAGADTDTLLGRLYEYGKRVARGEVVDPSFFFAWWEAAADDDPTDPAVWRKANPNLAEGLLDESDFESALASASGASGFGAFQRYRLNQWVRTAGEDFISAHAWAAAESETKQIEPKRRVTAGFDGSINNDATGLVIQDVETGLLDTFRVWEPDPNNPEWFVDPAEVDAAVEKMFDEYDVEMLWCDPAYFRDQQGDWAKRWRGKVEAIPASNVRMVPLAQQFLKDVLEKKASHTGDPALTRHVLNAVATEAGSYKKEKPKSPKKIDLLACAVLANGARHKIMSKPKTKRRVVVL